MEEQFIRAVLATAKVTAIALCGLFLEANLAPSSSYAAPVPASAKLEGHTKPLRLDVTSPIKLATPKMEAPACGTGKYKSNDDLCAQWKAADAANDAARYAFWALII